MQECFFSNPLETSQESLTVHIYYIWVYCFVVLSTDLTCILLFQYLFKYTQDTPHILGVAQECIYLCIEKKKYTSCYRMQKKKKCAVCEIRRGRLGEIPRPLQLTLLTHRLALRWERWINVCQSWTLVTRFHSPLILFSFPELSFLQI